MCENNKEWSPRLFGTNLIFEHSVISSTREPMKNWIFFVFFFRVIICSSCAPFLCWNHGDKDIRSLAAAEKPEKMKKKITHTIALLQISPRVSKLPNYKISISGFAWRYIFPTKYFVRRQSPPQTRNENFICIRTHIQIFLIEDSEACRALTSAKESGSAGKQEENICPARHIVRWT